MSTVENKQNPLITPTETTENAQAMSIKWRINANPEEINAHTKRKSKREWEKEKDQRGPVVL